MNEKYFDINLLDDNDFIVTLCSLIESCVSDVRAIPRFSDKCVTGFRIIKSGRRTLLNTAGKSRLSILREAVGALMT